MINFSQHYTGQFDYFSMLGLNSYNNDDNNDDDNYHGNDNRSDSKSNSNCNIYNNNNDNDAANQKIMDIITYLYLNLSSSLLKKDTRKHCICRRPERIFYIRSLK